MTRASERALNYARQREWRNLDRIHQSDAEIVAELPRILERTLDNCKAQAEAWYTRYAASHGMTPAEVRKRATEADIAALERKAIDYVRNRHNITYSFSDQANKEMAEYNFSMKMSREELLMRYIDLELSAGTDQQNQALGDHLSRLSEDELKRQAGLLGMRLPDHKELTDLARAIASSSFHGETFSDRLWQSQKGLRALLGDGIAKSILLGKNPMTWMRSLSGHLRDADNNAKYVLKRLAVTESGRVQIETQKQSYERSGYSQYIVVCEPTACRVCRQHDGKIYETKELMQGKNAPMFHPFCKCSTAPHVDRREVESAIAALEKAEGVSPEKRLQNTLESVRRNQEALTRSNIPKGMKMMASVLDKVIHRLGAQTDIASEINRANKNRAGWPSKKIDEMIERLGGAPESAKISSNGKKIIIDTGIDSVKIIYSPSGGYYRIQNSNYLKQGLSINHSYLDADLNDFAKIREMIKNSGNSYSQRLWEEEYEKRTHFKDE